MKVITSADVEGNLTVKSIQTLENNPGELLSADGTKATPIGEEVVIEQIFDESIDLDTPKYVDDEDLKAYSRLIKKRTYVRPISLTYAELKELRNTSKLVPYQSYIITDYETTTVQEYTRSAGHQFDILVEAENENRLFTSAQALHHTGDTYFSNSDLGSWQLKYTLDNDNSLYEWADEVNGKGVIYEMIDEWGNRAGYDFKNIQFIPVLLNRTEALKLPNLYKIVQDTENCDMSGIVILQDNTRTDYYYTFSNRDGSEDRTLQEIPGDPEKDTNARRPYKNVWLGDSQCDSDFTKNIITITGRYRIPYTLIAFSNGVTVSNINMGKDTFGVVFQDTGTKRVGGVNNITLGDSCYKLLFTERGSLSSFKMNYLNLAPSHDTSVYIVDSFRDCDFGYSTCNEAYIFTEIKRVKTYNSTSRRFCIGSTMINNTLSGSSYIIPGAKVTNMDNIDLTNATPHGYPLNVHFNNQGSGMIYIIVPNIFGCDITGNGDFYLVVDSDPSTTNSFSTPVQNLEICGGNYGTADKYLTIYPSNQPEGSAKTQRYVVDGTELVIVKR